MDGIASVRRRRPGTLADLDAAANRLLMASFAAYVVGNTYSNLRPRKKKARPAAAGASASTSTAVTEPEPTSGSGRKGKKRRGPRVVRRPARPRAALIACAGGRRRLLRAAESHPRHRHPWRTVEGGATADDSCARHCFAALSVQTRASWCCAPCFHSTSRTWTGGSSALSCEDRVGCFCCASRAGWPSRSPRRVRRHPDRPA